MIYTIRGDDVQSYTLQEKDEVKEILQNIRLFLSTLKGSVPMYRSFGFDGTYIDKPIPVAQALIRANLKEAVETIEPRATVESIQFESLSDTPGGMITILEVSI